MELSVITVILSTQTERPMNFAGSCPVTEVSSNLEEVVQIVASYNQVITTQFQLGFGNSLVVICDYVRESGLFLTFLFLSFFLS